MRRKLGIGIGLVLALLAGVIGPAVVAGAIAPPAECEDVLVALGVEEVTFNGAYKVEDLPGEGTVGETFDGTWYDADDEAVDNPGITLTVTGVGHPLDTEDGAVGKIRQFRWESDGVVVVAVIVKAGQGDDPYEHYSLSEYPEGEEEGVEDSPTYTVTRRGEEDPKEPGVSHITFCVFDDGTGTHETHYDVSGSKFYDLNHDGDRDEGEPFIEGWPITAVETTVDGEGEDDTTTGVGGAYTFTFPLGTTWTVDEVESQVEGWERTGGGPYAVTEDDVELTGLDFGNVCTVGSTNGHTLGFWSNKNGKALADADWDATRDILDDLNLVNADGTDVNLGSYATFKAFLTKATAKNMANMLSAQLAATVLNLTYGDQSGEDFVEVDGVWMSIDDAVAAAVALLGDSDVILTGHPDRAEATALKNVFDDLNNNRATVTPADHGDCPDPFPEVITED